MRRWSVNLRLKGLSRTDPCGLRGRLILSPSSMIEALDISHVVMVNLMPVVWVVQDIERLTLEYLSLGSQKLWC